MEKSTHSAPGAAFSRTPSGPKYTASTCSSCGSIVATTSAPATAPGTPDAADIGHVQIADAPGRGRPGTGRIDFGALFALLDEIGYTGRIALEYVDPRPDFAWMEKHRT